MSIEVGDSELSIASTIDWLVHVYRGEARLTYVKGSVPNWKAVVAMLVGGFIIECREIHTEEILLAGGVSLAVGEVVEELLDIRVEAVDRAGGDEAEDLHASVHAHPELPATSLNVDGGLLRSNRLDVAISGEPIPKRLSITPISDVSQGHSPDHKLIVTTVGNMVGVGSREEIVGNVGANVGTAVGPSSSRLHVADGADDALGANLESRVGVRLDVVLAAGPGPVNVPSGPVAVGPVDVSALRTRAGTLTPAVVVELVAAVGVVGVLVAERLSKGEWGEKPGEEDKRALHCEFCMR